MKNENQLLEICQDSARRLVQKHIETKARHEEHKKTLEQILVDWEDDETCSPHRVNDAMAVSMAKLLERLYAVVEGMQKDNDAPQT